MQELDYWITVQRVVKSMEMCRDSPKSHMAAHADTEEHLLQLFMCWRPISSSTAEGKKPFRIPPECFRQDRSGQGPSRGRAEPEGSAYVDVAALAGVAGAAHALVSVLRVLARAPVLARVRVTLVYVDLTAGKEECSRIVIYIFVPQNTRSPSLKPPLLFEKCPLQLLQSQTLNSPLLTPTLLLWFLWD